MPLYDAHLCLQRPADDALLWRFMDLAKFISMLQSHRIFLCPITQFEDKHEGLYHPDAYTILDDPVITLTVDELLRALADNGEDYALASVYYSDLILDPLFQYDSAYMPGLVKRPQFRYEQEVRLLHCAQNQNPAGIYLNIDIRIFFRHVIVSPYAPTWFLESIKGILNLLQIESTVQKSGLFLPHAIFRS